MTVTIEQLQAAIIKYIDSELGPKAVGWTKFSLYFVAQSIPRLVTAKMNEFKATGILDDILDEGGNIKLEELYSRTKYAMEKIGKLYIPKIDYNADIYDVEKLYSILKSL